jgi:putative NADPH-quinone reductase
MKQNWPDIWGLVVKPCGSGAIGWGSRASAANLSLQQIVEFKVKPSRHILIIQGHPDPNPTRFCRVIASYYAKVAEAAGHQISHIDVTALDFPVLRSAEDWQHGQATEDILVAQRAIAAANHLVIIYPLWLGGMPALLKAFLEQTLRPGFAIGNYNQPDGNRSLLKGKSARIIITMGMPGFIYRWFFAAHSLKSLKRNILAFCGIHPVKFTLLGMIEGSVKRREGYLRKIYSLASRGK